MSSWIVGPVALVGVVVLERLGTKLTGSRAKGWIASYLLIGLAALALGPQIPTRTTLDWRMGVGVALALGGYQVGRLALGDRPDRPLSESKTLELVALAGVVAPVEELLWGAVVGPEIGFLATAGLFAVKHPLVDGRWQRVLGLLLFWVGLSLVRAYSWPLALVLHMAANAGGVVIGHSQNLDQF